MKSMKLVLMVLVLTGCAASSHMIKQTELLPYKESSQITKLNQVNHTVAITSVTDNRGTKDLGFAYTGVEYKKTPVYFETSVSNLMKNQLSSSFEMRNIEVNPNGELKLSAVIKELQVYEVIEKMKPERAACKLSIEFSIDGTSTKWAGSFSTEFTSAGDMSDGTERLAPSLASCINELVEKVMNDEKFVKILKKE